MKMRKEEVAIPFCSFRVIWDKMISRITLNNGKVSTELLSERELGENDEYFDNGFPLPGSSVTDKSYLN